VVNGATITVGGTSAVSPLWAGLVALINEGLSAHVGFINPQLYASPATLHDITSGSNGSYSAVPGWDACTGLGSPEISLTTAYPNSWVIDSASVWGGVTLGSPACTQQWDINVPNRITAASSSTILTSPGTVTCGWTASPGDQWDDVAVEVKASP